MEEWIFVLRKNPCFSYYLPILILNFMILNIKCDGDEKGINILLQSDFQNPIMNAIIQGYQSYQSPMGAWQCSNSCELVNLPFYCNSKGISQCYEDNQQSINIQTSCQGSSINQNFTRSTPASYTLQYDWMLPQSTNQTKTIVVYIDQVQVHSLVINTNKKTQKFFTQQVDFNLTEGNHNINFTVQQGDCNKFYLDNIKLQFISSIATQNQTIITNSSSNNSINSTSQNTTNSTENNSTENNSTQIDNSQNSTASNNSNLDGNITKSSNVISEAAITAIDAAFNNKMTQIINSIPASRIAFSFLMKFYINIDRFNFYKYHRQNLTYYSSIFLEAIYALKEAQGDLLKDIVQQNKDSTLTIIIQKIKKKLQQFMGFKKAYSSNYFLSKNSLGSGFIENNIDLICYQLPIIIVMIFVSRFVFAMTFSCRISMSFRKYCFLPIFLVIIFEGNLEQFSYYLFSEFRYLFSKSYSHKISNILLLSFGFIIIFYCSGFFFYMRAYYKKNYRYFFDELNFKFISIIAVMIDCGIIPFLSAAIQYFCEDSLLIETCLLVLMELSWLIARICFIYKKIYAIPLRIVINILGNSLRIVFLISLYLFNQQINSGLYQEMHFYFIFSYIGIWGFEALLTVYVTIKEITIFLKAQRTSSSKIEDYVRRISHKKTNSSKKIKNQVANEFLVFLAERISKQRKEFKISKHFCRRNDITLKKQRYTRQSTFQFRSLFQTK